jgi:hypothetical protein
MKVEFQITEASSYPVTNPKTKKSQIRVRIAGTDVKGNQYVANVTSRQFTPNNPEKLQDYKKGTAFVDFYDEGDELLGGNTCTGSFKIVRNISCTPSINSQVVKEMGKNLAALMAQEMGIGSNLITIQGTPVSQAPVQEEVEEENDLVPEGIEEDEL